MEQTSSRRTCTKHKLIQTSQGVTYGTPKRIESDNGSPFNSRDWKIPQKKKVLTFAESHQDIRDAKQTRANGDGEMFMQTLKKTGRIATLEGKEKN